MKTPAQKIQGRIKNYCDDHGHYYNKTITMSIKGWPDVIIMLNHFTFYFEVKAPGDSLSPIQERVIEKLNYKHKTAFVVESYEDFLEIFQGLPKNDEELIKYLDKKF